jgi:hypothetical protein
MTLDILNIVQLGRERVLDVDDEDLPVGLSFIEESHDAEYFNLLNLPYITHLFADLANVQRIVVAVGLGLAVLLSRILPSLPKKERKIYSKQCDALRSKVSR